MKKINMENFSLVVFSVREIGMDPEESFMQNFWVMGNLTKVEGEDTARAKAAGVDRVLLLKQALIASVHKV
jgi:hypothetical protein